MRLQSDCIHCIIEHHWSLVKDCPDEERKCAFMREVCRMVSEHDFRFSAPLATSRLQALYQSMFSAEDDYPALRRKYNALLLERLPHLRARLRRAEDPLRLAVWMAMAGNYIDFGILKELDDDYLTALLDTPDERALAGEMERFRGEVAAAGTLLYITDNCGEIVLDRLLMEEIRRLRPDLPITALVRGEEVFNDATAADARFAGLDGVARIIGNGSNIGGTQPEYLSAEARAALEGADVIVAKGQGNFETLTGTGLNVYYLLLAKCEHYTRWFGMEHMKGQFLNERRFRSAQ